MDWWDWINNKLGFSDVPSNSTDVSDYNRAADAGPGDVGIKQVGTGGADSLGSSSISRDATGGSALGRDYTWRDWSQGLAQAAQAAGADNRFLPAGLALGAFGSGLTRGMDTSQEDRIKLQMQQALQSAQARNLLMQGNLAGAETDTKQFELQRMRNWDKLWGGGDTAAPLNTAQQTLRGAPADAGSFQERLIGRESSGNVAAQNVGGYSGLYQFGAPRLKDLGFYTPGPGENVSGDTWTGNKWSGTFNIPGFTSIKTITDFLKAPNAADAQHAAFGAHVNNIDTQIKAQGLDKYIGTDIKGTPVTLDGMRAAAHLGGMTGLKNYLTSGGTQDVPDSNGTTRANYMQAFASPSTAAAGSRSMMTPAQRQLADTQPVAPGSLPPSSVVPPRIPVVQAALPGSPTDQVPVSNVSGAPLNNDQRTLVAGPGAPTVSLGAPAAPSMPAQPVPGTPGAPAVPGLATPANAMDLRAVKAAMPPYLQAMVAQAGPVAGMKIVEDYVSKGIGRARLLTEPELAAYHFAPGSVVEATPRIGGGLPDFKVVQAGLPREPAYKIEGELYKDFEKDKDVADYKLSASHLTSLGNLVNKFVSKGDPSGTTSAAAVIELGKILDPSQVVRQTEADRLETQSVNPQVQYFVNAWNNGGARLDAKGMQDVLNVAKEVHNGRVGGVAATADFFRKRAEAAGVSADNVVNPAIFPRSAAAAPAEPSQGAPAPTAPVASPTATAAAPAVPTNSGGAQAATPAAPQPPALTADWAKTFKKPEDMERALRGIDTPTLNKIPSEEFQAMTTEQQNAIIKEVERRQTTATPQTSAITADFASKFKTPAEFQTALRGFDTPLLTGISDDEFKKMTPEQRKVLLADIARRQKAAR